MSLPYKYLQILEALKDNKDGLRAAQIVALCQKMPLNAVNTMQDCSRAVISLGDKVRPEDGAYGRIYKITEAGLDALKQETGGKLKTAPMQAAREPAPAIKPVSKPKEGDPSMKNKLIDLNNHLFSQLERLSDENLTGDKLNDEIDRAKSVTLISREIVANARLALDAQIALGDNQIKHIPSLMVLDSDA